MLEPSIGSISAVYHIIYSVVVAVGFVLMGDFIIRHIVDGIAQPVAQKIFQKYPTSAEFFDIVRRQRDRDFIAIGREIL